MPVTGSRWTHVSLVLQIKLQKMEEQKPEQRNLPHQKTRR